ncbi:MAG: ATP-dependent Clp protease proteolytic subunit [Clostridia bacterium]|nr:ATP-dependent Clp protease proteolytic subunit [Clostridia bacterium]
MKYYDTREEKENEINTDDTAEENSTDEEKAIADKNSAQFSNIEDTGSITTKNGDVSIHTIIIAGQVEGHQTLSPQSKTTKYEHILPQLVGIEDRSDIDGLLLLLNTVGGDVEAGLAIAETVAGMSKPSVSLVLGGGHSIGVPLAVCADKSFIVPSATMTLHPVRMNGLVIGVPQSFTYFTKMQDRILNFIVSHSNSEKSKLLELMMETDEIATDVGSVIDGKTAVEIGLIDSVGGLADAMDCLKALVKEKKKGRKRKIKTNEQTVKSSKTP